MKPTGKQFLICYLLVFVAAQAWVAMNSRPRDIFLAMSAINILFSAINILGACIGMATGWFPWRDSDDRQPKPKHSVWGFFKWLVS